MRPVHAYLGNAIASTPRTEQELDVEGIVIHAHPGEERPRGICPEQLEATLRVSHTGQGQHAYEQVKDAPRHTPVDPRVDRDAGGDGLA